jgi:hypothetical protein
LNVNSLPLQVNHAALLLRYQYNDGYPDVKPDNEDIPGIIHGRCAYSATGRFTSSFPPTVCANLIKQ